MTKSYCKPTTPIDQDNILNINDPNFDFEDEFCRRLNKLHGLADLFFSMGESQVRELSSRGCFGICNIFDDTAKELRAICYKMLEWEGGAK